MLNHILSSEWKNKNKVSQEQKGWNINIQTLNPYTYYKDFHGSKQNSLQLILRKLVSVKNMKYQLILFFNKFNEKALDLPRNTTSSAFSFGMACLVLLHPQKSLNGVAWP